ncbi:tetratricopeptide repeat protein [Pontibacter sp. JAM-7]|uniref:tetratricopeptide repeat protein n=1 Tax=Pontibacter sp. JAM-7 TaxID=3366581 RepID=UPI003AF6B565
MENRNTGKSVLIVDRSHEDLGTLRSCLSRLGFASIMPASSVNMALSLMREMQFDLVFSVYEMGDGQKNGLQLLQEANHEKILSVTSCFFLIVDQETSEVLHGSLENSPDHFIAKPYDFPRLQTAIEKLMRMKKVLASVEGLIDSGKLESVPQACDQVMGQYPGLHQYLLRIKAIALLGQGEYEQALLLFESMTKSRELPWAEVGKGMACYHLGRFKQAAGYFHRLIDQGQVSLEAYLWLARCYRDSCELERAVMLLRKAVMLQPCMPLLQAELADLAFQAGQYPLSVTAYQEAIQYAKHSVFQTPEWYFGCARALGLCNGQGQAERDMVELLERVGMEFETLEVKFIAKLMASVFYRESGNEQRQLQILQDAWRLYQSLPQSEQCERMELMADAVQDTELAAGFQERRREVNKWMLELPWGRHNLKGMAAFKKGDVKLAYECFSAAQQTLPTHMSIALNRVQASLELVKQDPHNALPLLLACADIMRGINFAALTRSQQSRYTRFSERCAQLLPELSANT